MPELHSVLLVAVMALVTALLRFLPFWTFGGKRQTPAVISYLNGQTGTELPGRGYATVYPTAMIGKIVASQVLVVLLL